MAFVDDLIGLECEDLTNIPCVLGIVDFLKAAETTFRATQDPEDEEEFKAGLTELIDGLNRAIGAIQIEIAKINAQITALRAGVAGLNAKIDALKAEIASITVAIDIIESYLADFPCPGLEPIKLMLEAVRALIIAQLALIDVSALTGLLDAALAQLNVLEGVSACLEEFRIILEN
jgi:hypothetical protein